MGSGKCRDCPFHIFLPWSLLRITCKFKEERSFSFFVLFFYFLFYFLSFSFSSLPFFSPLLFFFLGPKMLNRLAAPNLYFFLAFPFWLLLCFFLFACSYLGRKWVDQNLLCLFCFSFFFLLLLSSTHVPFPFAVSFCFISSFSICWDKLQLGPHYLHSSLCYSPLVETY